jgi:hypothetical protein
MLLVPLLGFASPSPLAYLLLLVIAPLCVLGVITLIGIAPTWRRSLESATPSTEVVRKDS